MKTAQHLFYYLVAFFVIVAAVYTFWVDFEEMVGVVALTLTAIMCAMIAWYIGKTAKKMDRGPDDDLDGEIAEGAGPYGHFSPHSWWPLAVAASCALFFLGIAIGWWMTFIAAPFIAISVVGWVFEYFRGEHAV